MISFCWMMHLLNYASGPEPRIWFFKIRSFLFLFWFCVHLFFYQSNSQCKPHLNMAIQSLTPVPCCIHWSAVTRIRFSTENNFEDQCRSETKTQPTNTRFARASWKTDTLKLNNKKQWCGEYYSHIGSNWLPQMNRLFRDLFSSNEFPMCSCLCATAFARLSQTERAEKECFAV